jgi:quinolinate synthase
MVEYFKMKSPDHTVVAYINTTAELKTVCDVCVTSSSEVKIVKNLPNDNIIFLPDCNLGDYVSRQVPEKNIKLMQGGCPVHAAVNLTDLEKIKTLHPEALVLVHPECVPKVVEQADFVGSTSAIMDYAKKSDAKEFIIGTEISIVEHLQYTCRDKRFYPLSKKILCPNMKLTTLVDVYDAVEGSAGEVIELDENTIKKARICIDEMIRLG